MRGESIYRFYLDVLGIKIRIYEPHPNTKYIPHNIAEAVHHKEYIRDYMDCCERALSKLLDISWREASGYINAIAAISQVNETRFLLLTVLMRTYFKELVISHDCMQPEAQTVGEFMYNHKEGNYLIITKDHALCYKDGIWYDSAYTFLNHVDILFERCQFIFQRNDSQCDHLQSKFFPSSYTHEAILSCKCIGTYGDLGELQRNLAQEYPEFTGDICREYMSAKPYTEGDGKIHKRYDFNYLIYGKLRGNPDDFIRLTHHGEPLYSNTKLEDVSIDISIDGKWYR
jgi:hypothetical protein